MRDTAATHLHVLVEVALRGGVCGARGGHRGGFGVGQRARALQGACRGDQVGSRLRRSVSVSVAHYHAAHLVRHHALEAHGVHVQRAVDAVHCVYRQPRQLCRRGRRRVRVWRGRGCCCCGRRGLGWMRRVPACQQPVEPAFIQIPLLLS